MTTDMEPQTHLITYLHEASPDHPLTDDEVLSRYGPLMWKALVAFSTDPGYYTDMCNAANALERVSEAKRAACARLRQQRQLDRLRQSLGPKVRLDGECWTWLAAVTNKGVPQMHRPGTPGSGSKITARSWTVAQRHGPDDTRWMIQASCGNRLCVNPDHATWRHVARDKSQTCR